MILLHLDQKGFTNFDNVNMICVSGTRIIAYMVDGSSHEIANCDSAEQANTMFMQLACSLEGSR